MIYFLDISLFCEPVSILKFTILFSMFITNVNDLILSWKLLSSIIAKKKC